jgi:hypothetical protein
MPAAAPERVSAEVRVPSPATAEVVAHALREVIKFLLFVRQQTPSSYDELRDALLDAVGPAALGLASAGELRDAAGADAPGARAGRKRKRVTSAERAAAKLFRDLDAMLACLTAEALRGAAATEVALLLGATPVRPKEMFVFDLARVVPSLRAPRGPTPAAGADAERTKDAAGRRAIRECLPAVAACAPAAGATKAFLLLRGAAAVRASPAGFLPKRGFAPVTRRTRVLAEFSMRPKDPLAGPGDADAGGRAAGAGDDRPGEDGRGEGLDGGGGDDDDDRLWYQCATTIKGVRGAGA